MPGTTRYSATFDRTYEEDDRVDPSPPPNARRSRSLSWQAHSGLDGGRPYTPLGSRPPSQRSSSTDNGPLKVAEHIPTRTVAKTAVKAHNNPFQFVKVGTCPLYKKAEEQLKKTKEVKKQDVLKEEEEEWQSNLDSWKSRRRKMSEDIFRRQEEIRQFELEEQVAQVSQKKTKTFSEMVESRSTRGRALSLCLISSPLDFQDWEFENKSLKNGSCSTFTDDSEENSTVNSEDEGVILRGRHLHLNSQNNNRTNGDAHIEQIGSKLEKHNGDYSKLDLTSNSVQKPKEGSYIDSGLESISSSHRAGDTPDSGSDFSQDSNSSIDCESPRTGINILEEFNSKSLQVPPGQEHTVRLALIDKAQEFGFTFQVDKDASQVLVTSVLKGSTAETSGVQVSDQIMKIDGIHVSSKQYTEIISIIHKKQEKGEMVLLLWRHSKTTNGFNTNGDHVKSPVKQDKTESQTAKSEPQQYEKSVESENEMYVDDFEELQRQSELLISSNKSETSCIKSEAQSNGNHSPTSIPSKTESLKTSSAPKQKEKAINGADNEINCDKTSSELITEMPKKNIIKVKRVRKKGVCGLDVSSTPNQIPQGVPVNYLYPLSPVTELPSPADETKTISSTLSSKSSTPVVKSEKSIFPKESPNEAEVKINSSNAKESASLTTVAKSAIFKNAIPTENQKISSLEKVENKTISSNVPVSPTNTKLKDINISLESSQDEKSKAPSSPKKVKVKVKKENKAETTEVLPESKSTSKTKSSVAKNKNLSLKIDAESKSANSDATSSVAKSNILKTPQDEKTISSLASKREKMKLKEDVAVLTEKLSTNTEEIKCTGSENILTSSSTTTSSDKPRSLSLNIGTQSESVNIPTTCAVIKTKPPKTPQDEKSKPVFQKKERAKSKDDSILSSEKSEARPKCDNLKGKSLVSDACLPDKTKELPLKTDAPTESESLPTSPAITNSKQLKSPQDEKAKPRLVRKRSKSKVKG